MNAKRLKDMKQCLLDNSRDGVVVIARYPIKDGDLHITFDTIDFDFSVIVKLLRSQY